MPRHMLHAAALAASLIASAAPAIAACPAVAPPAGTREAMFVRQVNARTPSYLAQFSVPGAAVAVIENGRIIMANGFGMADLARKTPVSDATLFNIGSTSKSISAWGAMRLVDQGAIGLDDPVDRRLTRWHLPPSSFAADGVTLRRLLSHTAGLSVSGYRGWGSDDRIPSLEQSLSGDDNGAGAVSIISAPGSGWAYSGGGYTLMQLLVEETTHRSFADYMRDAVLRPLGMDDSSFALTPMVLGRAAGL